MGKSSLVAQATRGFLVTLHGSTDVVGVTSSPCVEVNEDEPDKCDSVLLRLGRRARVCSTCGIGRLKSDTRLEPPDSSRID